MEVGTDQVLAFFNNPRVVEIENAIAEYKKCKIYKENTLLLATFQKKEIEESQLNIGQIEGFIENNSKLIVEFSKLFLEKHPVESLSCGVAISYAIYMIYLTGKTEKLLEEYIKRRRIPNRKNVLKHLMSIKAKMRL